MFYKSTHFLQLRVFVAEQRLEAIAADHDFQQPETFAIDSFFFHCLPPSNIKETSPQLICAEIHYWTLSTKLPLNMMHMHTVRPFSSRSLASTQNTTAIHNKIVGADDNQLGPHPTIYDESSSSSLYPMLSCADLFPIICYRLLFHSGPISRLISTLYPPNDASRSKRGHHFFQLICLTEKVDL